MVRLMRPNTISLSAVAVIHYSYGAKGAATPAAFLQSLSPSVYQQFS